MAHDLYSRLMHQSDDDDNYPNLPNHGFFALLKEYARRKLDNIKFTEIFNIDGGDSLLQQMFSYIDAEADTAAISRAQEIEDVFLIHEHPETNDQYPTKESIIIRLNMP